MKAVSHFISGAIFPAVTTLFFGLAFVYLYLEATVNSPLPAYREALVFAVPFTTSLILMILYLQKKISSSAVNITTGILFIPLIFFLFICIIVISFITGTRNTDNPGSYPKVLRQFDNEYTVQFPDEIPENASEVKFYYCPQFLQGGSTTELSMTLPEHEAREYRERLESGSVWHGSLSQLKKEDYYFTVDFKYSDTDSMRDYGFYVFRADDCGNGYDWNHGVLSLAAVNERTCHIILQLQYW